MFGLVLLVLGVSAASQWWAGSQERSLGREVAALAQPGDIHMMSSDTCAICSVARHWFIEHRVAFTECSVERDDACRASFEATGAVGTPVMVVRGQPQLGFLPARLKGALQPRVR